MKFFSKQNFREIINGFENGLERYPLALLFSFFAALTTYIRVDLVKSKALESPFETAQLFFFLMIPVGFAFHLFRKRGMSMSNKIMLLLSTAAVIFTALGYSQQTSSTRFYYIMLTGIAVHCMVACGFLATQKKYFFWNANVLLLYQFLFASVVSTVTASGITGLISLFSYLIFKIPNQSSIIAIVYCFGCVFLHTWVFVSGCNFENIEEDEEGANLGPIKYLKYILQYVYIPLVFLYATTLILYLGKIIVLFNLPKGGVAYFVISLSVSGILAYLLGFRFVSQSESSIFRLFKKYFFYMLCPLLVLLWIATYRRLADYGISPDRYILIIMGLWLTFVTAYILIQKSEHLSAIPPLSLWAVCTLMVLTPLNPTDLPVRIMTQKIHQDLELAKSAPESKNADYVRSALREIAKLKKQDWIEKEFKILIEKNSNEYEVPNLVLKALEVQDKTVKEDASFCRKEGALTLSDVHAKTIITDFEFGNRDKIVSFDTQNKELTFHVDGNEIVYNSKEVMQLLDTCRKDKTWTGIPLKDHPHILFYPSSMNGFIKNGEYTSIYDMKGTIVVNQSLGQ